MPSLPRRPLIVLLLATALLLSACQVPLPYLPIPLEADETSAAPSEEPSAPAEVEETTSDGEMEATDAGDVAVDAGEMAAPQDADKEMAAEVSEEVGDDAAAASLPSATIVVRSLRIRSGPGVEYDIVAGASQGESFPILGQAFDCQWLKIEHPTLGEAWLSGLPQYTAVDAECAQLSTPEASTTAEEAPVAVAEEPAPEEPAAAPTPTPEAQQEAAETEAGIDALPADLGCYLIQNYLGPELNVTVTAKDREWSDNFQIGENVEVPYCLQPGSYTVTIDAPPPWADLNDELTVQAGDRFFWPIRSGE